ncbi:MAG: glycosyltransferase family 4 protein [Polyangia bacterium]|jgi:glycosyltransferase involved in cell wall biosynthesis
MSKRRVLFVIKSLQQGGTERQVLRMLGLLDPNRFEVALCTLAPEIHYSDVPAGQPRFPLNARGAGAIKALAAVIEEFQPDLIHSFRDNVNRWVRAALSRIEHAPTWLMSVRGRPVLPWDLLWSRIISRRAYRVVVNSLGIERTLRRFAGIRPGKIAVIPNLLNPEAFRPPGPGERVAAREYFGLSADAFVWAFPARISWVKNQLGLLWSLALLVRWGALPEGTVFLLAGRPRDQIPSALLPKLARALGVEKYLRVLPPEKEPRVLYTASDALVLPSWAEGMPNVVLEAQLMGLPVVVTRQANWDAAVSTGYSGYVVSTGSPRALAEAMRRLMSLSEIERRAMGARGRTSLLERFPPGPIMESLGLLYEQAIATQSARPVELSPARPGTQKRRSAEGSR